MHVRAKPFIQCLVLGFSLLLPATSHAIHAAGTLPAVSVGNDQLALSLQGSIGMAQGEAREVAYSTDELGREFKLSELTWDIDQVVMAGGTLAVQIGPRYRVQAGYWAAITEGSGSMNDYDWLFGPETPWSDWSLSDAQVKDSCALDVNISAEVYRKNELSLSAVLGYRQDQWSWDDQARRFIYSESSFRDSYGELDGLPSITYEQQFRIPYAGVVATLHGERASAEAYFHYSPLVEAEDHDYHLLRGIKFDSKASNGDYFGTGLRVGYRFTPQISSTAAAEWQVIPEMRGDSTLHDAQGAESFANSAGIANQWMLLSLSVGYDF